MAKPTKSYWTDRAAQREMESQLIASKYLARMDESLRETQQDILRQIEVFYARYANDNKITLAEARKYLTAKELKEFKEVNLKRFKEMSLRGEAEYENLLNAISFRVRISRLEALNLQIEMQMAELYNGLNGLQAYTYTGLSEVYQTSYYQMMFGMAQAGIISGTVTAISDKTMQEILTYNWSGKEFSKRIWGHEEKTKRALRKELEKSFASGRSIQKTTKAIVEVTDVARSRAEALVRTESNFFHGLAAQNSYVDAGMEKYEVLATLDFRTSDKCRGQDGKIYNVSDYKPGITANPFHTRCRTTTIPYFDDEEYMENEKRESLDGPIDSLTFEEWFNKYVVNENEGSSPEILSKQISNRTTDKEQYSRYIKVLGKSVLPSFAEFQDMKYNNLERWRNIKGDYRKRNAYNKIALHEPKITADLKSIAKTTNVQMVGLEYRLKTMESYLRKVETDSKRSLDIKVISDTISNTNDVIRYTYQSDVNSLVKSFNDVIIELQKKGYSIYKIKNSWNNKSNPYKGINCIFISPDNQKFELQFHTPESFELKNGIMHKLYEEYRLDTTSSERKKQITHEMFQLSSNLTKPININEIK
ncbi:minor capsid protein [Psychrobacillus sp. FJAT-21963]|uniref:minor capsid protein n=1 Tax=Psychrobacillus sp. FJAT-21963 TaxID=1712028 RepID=UPI0006FB383A|nr:minor capsid protein [Psychrobacillus sp. FJAT-21963]